MSNRLDRAPRGMALMIVVAVAITVAAIAVSVPSGAAGSQEALVGGILTTPGGGPVADRQIHFENRVSGVLYLVRTDSGGKFSAHLPPGVYDLREERGTIIRAGIAVSQADADLGKMAEPVIGFWFDPFQFEELGERIINGPAPATANLPDGGIDTRPAASSAPPAAPK